MLTRRSRKQEQTSSRAAIYLTGARGSLARWSPGFIEMRKRGYGAGQYLTPGEQLPIEGCTQPVLLIHGLADDMWGPNWSPEQTKTLERRLRALGKDVDTLYLEGENHILSPYGRYHARVKVLEFLNRVFEQPAHQD